MKKKKMFVFREWTPNWRVTDMGPARCSEGSRDPSLGICSCMCITSYHASTWHARVCPFTGFYLRDALCTARSLPSCGVRLSVCLSVCLSVTRWYCV